MSNSYVEQAAKVAIESVINRIVDDLWDNGYRGDAEEAAEYAAQKVSNAIVKLIRDED